MWLLKMSLKSMVRQLFYRLYDYQSVYIDNSNIKLAVIHIPDQIGDAMSVFPVIRALEAGDVKHLLIVSSTINQSIFETLSLRQTKLTVISMSMQDNATFNEIKTVARKIRKEYGTPDICIEAMRRKNLKTMLFINRLRARTNLQVAGLTMKCYSPVCKTASRMDQIFRAPVPMTWAILMRDAGFPLVRAVFEFPLSEAVLTEVRSDISTLGRYIALNLEGSAKQRTFSLPVAEKLIAIIKKEIDLPIVIVHGPKGVDSSVSLTQSCDGVHRLSLPPSIMRSAAVINGAFLVITPDTSILHMASAYNIPAIAVYADYKTRWPAMQDISETIAVGKDIDHINLDEFRAAIKRVITRIQISPS